jgi:glutathione S-transferase
MPTPARLVTIPFSHYVEKARWALERSGPPFEEEGHLPLLHWTASLRGGGGRTVPVLHVDGRVFCDSTDILRYVDEQAPPDKKLYPEEPSARRECEELEEFFDEKLGPDTRRVAYFHLLPHTQKMAELISRDVTAWERTLAPFFVPVLRAGLRRFLRLDAAGVARSLERIDAAFSRVATRLSDGRRYLLGDRFTAADLTFAAMAAPVLGPDEYGASMPPLSWMPPAVVDLVERHRATPAGAFALRVYREDRRAPS